MTEIGRLAEFLGVDATIAETVAEKTKFSAMQDAKTKTDIPEIAQIFDNNKANANVFRKGRPTGTLHQGGRRTRGRTGDGAVGVGVGWGEVCLLVGCLTSQQHASVSQGRICSDNFTCCHTEIEVADQTFYLTQSQYTDTGPTSPSADPITPGAWQGSHWSASF